jgi:hypothetical protein
MIDKPTFLIYRTQSTRDKWRDDPGYPRGVARCLDIELQALRLLLLVTRIVEEEVDIAATHGMGGTTDG